jgi:hypothetical protein
MEQRNEKDPPFSHSHSPGPERAAFPAHRLAQKRPPEIVQVMGNVEADTKMTLLDNRNNTPKGLKAQGPYGLYGLG